MANRIDEIGGIWAEGAPDVPDGSAGSPTAPQPGTTYGNSKLTPEEIITAWPYTAIISSGKLNEMVRRVTTHLIQMEKQGVLAYSVLTNYVVGALVLGSDYVIYSATEESGPDTPNGVMDPVDNPGAWKKGVGDSISSISTSGLATTGPGNPPITDSGNIDVPESSSQQALDGTDATTAMTPRRVHEAIFDTSLWKPGVGEDIHRLLGNVGIGTITPAKKLDVVGDAGISTDLEVGDQLHVVGLATFQNQIQILGGVPGAGKVLTDVVGTGLAIWKEFPVASETLAGIVELSNTSESTTGTSFTTAMSPARVRESIRTSPLATTTVRGVVLKSTFAQNQAGIATDVWPDVAGVTEMFQSGNAGFWNPASGTDNIFYDKGYVGIGTGTPVSELEVAGHATFRGMIWREIPSLTVGIYTGVAYGDGIFVAVQNEGLVGRIMTTTNGENWTVQHTSLNTNWGGVIYGNGLFIAVSLSGTDQYWGTSPNGRDWSFHSLVNRPWNKGIFAQGHFIIIGQSGHSNHIVYSRDGVSGIVPIMPFEAPWSGITYGDGLFVMVNSGSVAAREKQILTSSDGINWQTQTTPIDSHGENFLWADIKYGNGIYVVVGVNSQHVGVTMMSPNGIDWTSWSLTPISKSWANIIFENNWFIVFSRSNNSSSFIISRDGVNWEIKDLGVVKRIQTSAYGNGLIVAMGDDAILLSGEVDRRVISPESYFPGGLYVSDTLDVLGSAVIQYPNAKCDLTVKGDIFSTGFKWKGADFGIYVAWRTLVRGNGITIIACQETIDDRVLVSYNGVNWIRPFDLPILDRNGNVIIFFERGTFFLIIPLAVGNGIYVSTDGINWERYRDSVPYFQNVAYGNDIFVAVGTAGGFNEIVTSPNGLDWTFRPSIGDTRTFGKIIYARGIFIALANDRLTNPIMTSPDGISWTMGVLDSTNIWRDLTYGNNLFIAIAGDKGSNQIATSIDGINWQTEPAIVENIWTGIEYGHDLYVAISSGGFYNSIMTSKNGIDWEIQEITIPGNYNYIVYDNDSFVALSNVVNLITNEVLISGQLMQLPSPGTALHGKIRITDRVQIEGGEPGAGKVLTSLDDKGLAKWMDCGSGVPGGGTVVEVRAGGIATTGPGNPPITFDGEITVSESTTQQAIDGTDNSTAMTPRRVKDAINQIPIGDGIWEPQPGTDNIHRLDGNVGIGTITPTRKLDVVGDANISTSLGVGTDAAIGGTLGVTGDFDALSNASVGINLTVTGDETVGGTLGVTGLTTLTDQIQILGGAPGIGKVLTDVVGTGLATWEDPAANYLWQSQPATDNIHRLDGNVGIGTIAPTQKLDVAGNTRMTGDLSVGTDATIDGQATVTGDFDALSNASVGINLTVTGDETVGGTLGVTGKATLTDQIQILGGVPGIGKVLTDVAGTGLATWEIPATTSLWDEDPNNQNIYRELGNVGIGTATPTEKLHVAGNAQISGNLTVTTNATVTGNLQVTGNEIVSGTLGVTGKATLTDQIQILGGVPGAGKVLTDVVGTGLATWEVPIAPLWEPGTGDDIHRLLGNVGIGTITPTQKLHVAGNAFVSTNLEVGGSITVTGQVNVTGNTDIGGTLGVTGLTTLTNQIQILGGAPGVGYVLTDTAGTGLATWEDPTSNFLWQKDPASENIHRIDGNVGIGNDNPTVKLEVFDLADVTTVEGLRITNDSSSAGGRVAIALGNSHLPVDLTTTARISTEVGTSFENPLFAIEVADDVNVLQERMTIDKTGLMTIDPDLRVIRNATVDGTLGVIGKATLTDVIQIQGGNPGVDKVLTAIDLLGNATWQAGGGSGGLWTPVGGGTDDIYHDAGNVGIGTIAPTRKLDVVGDANISTDLGVGGVLDVGGNAAIGGTLGVIGVTTLGDNLNVIGNGGVSGHFDVGGNGSFGGTLNIASNTGVGGTLNVTGDTSLSNLTVTGDETVGGTLGVTGDTTLINLTVTGDETVGGTLGVTGLTTLTDQIQILGGAPGPGKILTDLTGSGLATWEAGSAGGSQWIPEAGTGNIYRDTGYVGFGTIAPRARVDVAENADDVTVEALRVMNTSPSTTGRAAIALGNSSDPVDDKTLARISTQIGAVATDAVFIIEVADDANVLQERMTIDKTGLTTIDPDLRVTNDATVDGTLGVIGDTTLNNITVIGSETIDGNLGVTGFTILTNLGVTANQTVDGTLGVTGLTTLTDQIQILGGVPGPGKVLTASDLLGNATWEAGSAGGSRWSTLPGSGNVYRDTGYVGFGTRIPTARIEAREDIATGTVEVLKVVNGFLSETGRAAIALGNSSDLAVSKTTGRISTQVGPSAINPEFIIEVDDGTGTLHERLNIDKTGKVTLATDLDVIGNETITGSFSVTGTSSLTNLNVSNQTTSLNLGVTSGATIRNLTVIVNEMVGGILEVTGDTTLSNLNVTGDETVDGTLGVTGKTTLIDVIQIQGGSPNIGRVLTATDIDGNSSWQDVGGGGGGSLWTEDPVDRDIWRNIGIGQVGIGTSDPQFKLDVHGTTNITLTLGVGTDATVGGTLGVTGDTTLSNLGVTGLSTLANTTVGGTLGVTGDTTVDGTLGVTGKVTLDVDLDVLGNANVTSDFDAGGSVSVGDILDVTGNSVLSGTIQIKGGNPAPNWVLSAMDDTGLAEWRDPIGGSLWQPGTGEDIHRLLGNIGIGTITPTRKLDVVGDANVSTNLGVGEILTVVGSSIFQSQIQILAGGTLGAGKILTDVDGNGLATWQEPVNESLWQPGTGEDIHRLNGNVGIGTITPTQKLHVEGNIHISTDATIGGTQVVTGKATFQDSIQIQGGTPTTIGWVLASSDTDGNAVWAAPTGGGGGYWDQLPGSTNIYYDVPGGNVGVGTDAPTAPLEVAGDIFATSDASLLKITNSADSGVGRTAISLGNSNSPHTDQRYARISAAGGNTNYDNPSFYIEVADGTNNGLQPRISIDKAGLTTFEQQIQIKGGTPVAGYVLTATNIDGLSSWQNPGTGGGFWNPTPNTTNIFFDTGYVGAGTNAPTAQLEVVESVNDAAIVIETLKVTNSSQHAFGRAAIALGNSKNPATNQTTARISTEVGTGYTAPLFMVEVVDDGDVLQERLTIDKTGLVDFSSQIQIRGGNPAIGHVLACLDSNGNSEWRDINNLPTFIQNSPSVTLIGKTATGDGATTSTPHDLSQDQHQNKLKDFTAMIKNGNGAWQKPGSLFTIDLDDTNANIHMTPGILNMEDRDFRFTISYEA